MSKEAVVAFLAQAKDDEALMTKVRNAVEDSEDPTALIALGQENGFEFTAKEAVSFFRDADNDDLSEDDLAAVAGGAISRGGLFGGLRMPTSWSRLRGASAMHDALGAGAMHDAVVNK